jgi:PAS domain S-box-containing protein
LERLHPDDRDGAAAEWNKAVESNKPFDVEFRLRRKDGVYRWFKTRAIAFRDRKGQIVRWFGTNTDIESLKRAEEKLRESEARYKTLVENIPQKILMKDRNFRWVSINENLARDFGFRPEEVVGKMDADLFTPELAAKYHSDDVRIIETGKTEELEEKYIVAGKETWVNTIKTPIRGETGEIEGVLGVFWDITERKRAESELRRYVDQVSVINRLDRVISSTFEIDEVYDALVSEMQHLFEFDRTSLIRINDEGTEWQIIKQWTIGEPAFVPGIWRKLEGSVVGWLHKNKRTYVGDRIGEGENWPETDLLRKEGISSRVFVPLIVKGNVIGVMTLASKNSNVYSKPDLQILESLADQVGISMHNARMYGKVREFAATLEKRVEDRTAQLEVANKELEAFAYSVSHDLRAPLRHINGFIELLGKDQGSGVSEKNARYLQIICEAAKQMGELIDDLLTFSRMAREELRKTCLNPTPVVNDVVASLRSEIEGRTVRWMIHELPMVTADPAMLKLVFVNLISNAQKFTRTRDVAEIEVGTIESDGKEIILFVKDNGVGFDMEYVHKLFGVFQRLHSKDEFEGTGIGLANVRRIISRHGGRTWAEGTVGVGASFYFSLPATT